MKLFLEVVLPSLFAAVLTAVGVLYIMRRPRRFAKILAIMLAAAFIICIIVYIIITH